MQERDRRPEAEEATETGQGLRGKVGGYVGVTVGVCGWLIGLTVFLAVEGRFDLALELLPIGLGASLALAFVILLSCELLLRVEGRPGPLWGRGLAAGLALATGVLLFVSEATVLPALRADPALSRPLERLGSPTSLPGWLAPALLYLAAALYFDLLRRLVRHGVPERPGAAS